MNSMNSLEEENKQLRERLKYLEEEIRSLKKEQTPPPAQIQNYSLPVLRLSNPEILRYSRQLILPDIGIKGQLALSNASILIVGAGGLGAPAALYLAAAGVGHLGIVDHDYVEISNLHRQIIHNEARVGISKAFSAKSTIESLNSNCRCVAYETLLDSSNAQELINQYDIVLDATDNVATRYLLNDACVIGGKPLISGSALRMEGQLTIYNYHGGPCYRCLFPTPPPPETVTNCSDGGVLGAVTGVIGTLQALEAIKIVTGLCENWSPTLLLFTATSIPPFRSIKLRLKKKDCAVCGEEPTVRKLIDYVQFCGSSALDKSLSIKVLTPEERISVKSYSTLLATSSRPQLLLDVRESVQFDICRLEGSLNIPLKDLERRIDEVKNEIKEPDEDVFVVCRMGNDSQLAVRILQKHGITRVKDVNGGLYRWAKEVDPEFPIY